MSQCLMLPTINDLAQDYRLPALVELFSQRITEKKVAEVRGLSVPELGLDNADLDVVFSYADEFPRSKGYCPTIELTLQNPADGGVVARANIGEDQNLKGRFNRYTGYMPVDFDTIQFAIDNPPHKLIKDILCDKSNAHVKHLI